uniref:retention module-containing protein n=1 Tax=Nitrincola schmidtii TaxID=1730894 RepID=UPI00124F4DF4
MSVQIATVASITGEAFARQSDGTLRQLAEGDALFAGETLVVNNGSQATLNFDGNELVNLTGPQELPISETQITASISDVNENIVTDPSVAAILAALEGDGDLLDELEAPAAGTDGAPDGGGSSFVQLTRISESVDPLAFEFEQQAFSTFEAPISDAGEAPEEPEAPAPDAPAPINAVVTLTLIQLDAQGNPLLNEDGSFIFLDGDSIIEGTFVGVLANVDVPPTETPLVIVLSDGLGTITIPVGGNSGFTPIEIREDDVYFQGEETFTVGVDSTSGGGYDSVDTGSDTEVSVIDNSDATTVSIGSVSGLEGTTGVTVTAEISSAPISSPLVITLSNGATITFNVGQTVATSTPFDLPILEHGVPGSLTDEVVSISLTGTVTSGGGQFESVLIDNGMLIISDDTPSAVDDGMVTVTEDGDVQSVSGNVLLNDSYGADGPAATGAFAWDDNTAAINT